MTPLATESQESMVKKIQSLRTAGEYLCCASELHRRGLRKEAVDLLQVVQSHLVTGKKPIDGLPVELIARWKQATFEGVAFSMITTLCGFSAFYKLDMALPAWGRWVELEPGNGRAHWGFGLCLLLGSTRKSHIHPRALEEFQIAKILMNEELATAAEQLSNPHLRELILPYDDGRLCVYPTIQNATTFCLLEKGDWFEDDIHLFRRMIRDGTRVLDLGANVGTYSLSAARRVGSDGIVVSVEPCEKTHTLLKSSAQPYANWRTIRAGISDHCGSAHLKPGHAPELNELDETSQEGEAVPLLTVDALEQDVGMDGFDLVKMDVEGHELEALRGGTHLFETGSPIVLYENKHGDDVSEDLWKRFTELGYRSYYYIHEQNCLEPVDARPMDEYVLNFWAVKPEALDRLRDVVEVRGHRTALPLGLGGG